MLMAQVFDFRNSKSYFSVGPLFTAFPVRPAGLENPNIVVKHSGEERRASQVREFKALLNNFLESIPQLGTKGRSKKNLRWVQRGPTTCGP